MIIHLLSVFFIVIHNYLLVLSVALKVKTLQYHNTTTFQKIFTHSPFCNLKLSLLYTVFNYIHATNVTYSIYTLDLLNNPHSLGHVLLQDFTAADRTDLPSAVSVVVYLYVRWGGERAVEHDRSNLQCFDICCSHFAGYPLLWANDKVAAALKCLYPTVRHTYTHTATHCWHIQTLSFQLLMLNIFQFLLWPMMVNLISWVVDKTRHFRVSSQALENNK